MQKTEVVAEIGINHNGDLKQALQLIDVAVAAGCDFVKFQKRTIEDVYTKEELDEPRKSPWGMTNRDQKNGLEFGANEYLDINAHCRDRGIGWFASPWDLKSIDFLANFGTCAFIKVPSALMIDIAYLKACRATGRKLILSTGMCNYFMIDRAVEVVGRNNIHCLMHCTSTYPSKPEELNLACIPAFHKRYPGMTIGFSNHNPGIIYMPAAVALGAGMIEFHITLDRASYGSDQPSSIEPEGAFKLIKHIRGMEKAIGDGNKIIYESEVPIIDKLRKIKGD